MANVMMCWELGGGLGHLQRLRPVAEELRRRGHAMWLALRDLSRAGVVFQGLDVRLLQAPIKFRPISPADEIRPPSTLPQILHNVGFADESELASLASAWRSLFDAVRPDVILFDHSPTALLASRGIPAERVLIGTGFCCPPDEHPMPNLRPWAPADPAKLVADEENLLARANRVLAGWGQPPLERLGRLYSDVDEVLLTTFRELDHYPGRAQRNGDGSGEASTAVRYRGVYNRATGRPPHWPAGSGRRVFAYLKPFAGLEEMLRKLNDLKCPALVFCDGVARELQEKHRSPTLRFENNKFDMTMVARECDVAITNANHGTTAGLLLAGKPMLHVPLFLEQVMLARAVARLGAGLFIPPDRPEVVAPKMDELLRTPTFARAAAAFAAKYAGFDPVAENSRMADDVERLVT